MFHVRGLKFYAGLDWGFTDPTAIVVVATDGERAFVVYSHAQSNMEPIKHVVPLLHKLEGRFGKLKYFPDTARPDNNAALISSGFDIMDQFDKGRIDSGITQIRSFLSPTIGRPKAYFLKGECDPLIDEILKYHYVANTDGTISDDIADEFNHSIDAMRYLFINVFSTDQGVRMVVDTTDDKSLPIGISSITPNFAAATTGVAIKTGAQGQNGFVFNFGDDMDD
jgi:phage terminase large subunit